MEKEIEGFPDYHISRYGHVISLKHGQRKVLAGAADNLEWSNRSANMKHAVALGNWGNQWAGAAR